MHKSVCVSISDRDLRTQTEQEHTARTEARGCSYCLTYSLVSRLDVHVVRPTHASRSGSQRTAAGGPLGYSGGTGLVLPPGIVHRPMRYVASVPLDMHESTHFVAITVALHSFAVLVVCDASWHQIISPKHTRIQQELK